MSRFNRTSGGVDQIYSASSLASLDQSPPMTGLAPSPFVTERMMAAPARLSIRPPPLQARSLFRAGHKADSSMNWRQRTDEHAHLSETPHLTRLSGVLSLAPASSSLFQRQHSKLHSQSSVLSQPAHLSGFHNDSPNLGSSPQSGLTTALANRKSATAALARIPPPDLSVGAGQPFEPVDDSQELLGRAGEDSQNAAFIVRSKVSGALSIFKPADGESTREEHKARRAREMAALRGISGHFSPSLSSSSMSSSSVSEPVSPVSPLSPTSAHHPTRLVPTAVSKVVETSPSKTPLRRGVVHGETALKEAAAFVLDESGFSGVPPARVTRLLVPRDPSHLPVIDPSSIIATKRPMITHGDDDTHAVSSTAMIRVPRSSAITIGQSAASLDTDIPNDASDSSNDFVPRFGSLSAFVPHISSADEMGSSLFSAEDVHRIAILDIRILNLDRHLANILVSKDERGKFSLHPIDHGYSLPSYQQLQDVRFEWTNWRQTLVPFSQASLAFIESLDPIADCLKLQKLGIRHESLVSLVFSTLLLKRGAAAGLCLRDIANMCQRQRVADDDYDRHSSLLDDSDDEDDGSEPSVLEQIVARVLANSGDTQSVSVSTPTCPPAMSTSPSDSPTFSFSSPSSVADDKASRPFSRSHSSVESTNPTTAMSLAGQSALAADSALVRMLSVVSDVIDCKIESCVQKLRTDQSLVQ